MTGYSATTFVMLCLHLCYESECWHKFHLRETCIEPFGTVLQIIPICSLLSCIVNCNTDITCRSAVYDMKHLVCKTNNETTKSFSNGCSSPMKYIERGQSSVLGPCSLGRDCATVDSFCNAGTCECRQGLTYNQTEDLCVESYRLCTPPWVGFNGSCYLFGNATMEFYDAKNYCVEQSAYVVHVNSMEENEFLVNYMNGSEIAIGTASMQTDTRYWIGMTDDNEENIWKWVGTEEPATYFNWFPGQPDTDYEHCVQYFNSGWNNIACNYWNEPICEK